VLEILNSLANSEIERAGFLDNRWSIRRLVLLPSAVKSRSASGLSSFIGSTVCRNRSIESSTLRYNENMSRNDWFKLGVAVIGSELAGIIGAVFTTPSITTWYATIVRPEFSPPNWIFGPVWTTLYALMGIAAFLVWKKGLDRKDVKIALGIFLGQLALNTLWSIIFFGLQKPFFAFIGIFLLWISILITMYLFRRINTTTVYLLAPYLLWVSFASVLNYLIVF